MEELYCENAKIVFHFLLAISNNKDIAEELTQETFLKAYQSIGNYDGSCKISTWLCSIAKNAYYQYLVFLAGKRFLRLRPSGRRLQKLNCLMF